MDSPNAAPVEADFNTNAMAARMIARKVVTTAASWGLLPKGAATKKDQLASEKPKRTWTRRMMPKLVSAQMRDFQMMEMMIHAGRYEREMLRCQELMMKGR
jgi:hypothetical protein